MCWKTAAAGSNQACRALNLLTNKSQQKDALLYFFSILSNLFKPRLTGVFDPLAGLDQRHMQQ
ncbi:hypothetical protein P0D69_36775 [Paraburkholderia sediminicola]|uniref:hypothetical protein n=1 Tax=Paraburkholderia sediminicola TaxID=458836 RepID=UPI0038BC6A85